MMTGLATHRDGELPPFSSARIWTVWDIEPTVLILVLLPATLYVYGVIRLARAGTRWSPWRTMWFFVGLFLAWLAMSSVVGVYDTTLFSVHTVQHLLLQMLAPIPLALGAPITLALRALPVRGRKLLVGVLHSRVARLVSHPALVSSVFFIGPFVLYYSPLFENTLRHGWVHNLSHLHFLLVGCLLFWIVIGIDPHPHRPPHLARLGMVIGLAPMHILLGVPIMMGTQLLAANYYQELTLSWLPNALDDQQLGGALLWVFGDIAVLALMPAFIWQWVKSDQREARRVDRHLDRLGDTATKPWWEQGPRHGRDKRLDVSTGER